MTGGAAPNFHEANTELARRPSSLALRALEQLHQVKRIIPATKLPDLVRKRIDKLWELDDFRAMNEAQMAVLLSETERSADIPTLARSYAERMMLRGYLRFHPRAVSHQEIRGAEWVTTELDRSRSSLLIFMHHGQFDGLFSSLANVGGPVDVLVSPLIVGKEAAINFKQHYRVVTGHRRTGVVVAEGGAERIKAQLRPGRVLAMAPDVPGRSKVRFLGQDRMASAGFAHMAIDTNSPVILATAHQDPVGAGHVQLHRPLEPRDFESAEALLAEVLRRFEAPILAFPDGVETPGSRFGPAPGPDGP